MKKSFTLITAATCLTLGVGAFAVPTFAQADGYRQYRQYGYTQNESGRFSTYGNRFYYYGDRKNFARQRLFDRIDRKHKAY